MSTSIPFPNTALPPDYTPLSAGHLPPPPPYSAAAPPTPSRRPPISPRASADDGPAHPPIPRPPRRGYSDDSSSSRGGPSSWRRYMTNLGGAMSRLDVSSDCDKPLPPVPGNPSSSARDRRSSVPPPAPQHLATPPRHVRAHSHSPARAPPIPPRPTGQPQYPPVSAYNARSLMAPRPSLHPNDPASVQVESPPRLVREPRELPAPVPKTSTSFRPQSLYAPNPTLTTHAPMLRPTPAPPHHPVHAHPAPAPVHQQVLPPRSRKASNQSSPKAPNTRTLSQQLTPPRRAAAAAPKTEPPTQKKFTKLIPTGPSGVSFLSPLYAAASSPKGSSSTSPKGLSSTSPKGSSSTCTSTSRSTSLFVTTPQRRRDVIDMTLESDDETPESSDESDLVVAKAGKGRAARLNGTPASKASSSKVSTPAGKALSAPKTVSKPKRPLIHTSGSSTPPVGPAIGTPVRCAGYTRAGQPCKRMVRVRAPFLANHASDEDEDTPRAGAVGRYCRDHAGLVCAADGFYWRDGRGKAGVWIDFKDYIPSDLGQQTQTLLRVTMESPLTSRELPGFLYAYELRDLGGSRTSFFKVGRTDNVPRRIGQWTKQCTSHTPTLRDVFPLKAPPAPSSTQRRSHLLPNNGFQALGTGANLNRAPSLLGSLLPGATRAGTDAARMVPAVKRWERLVHLELADRAASARPGEYDALCAPCTDCGSVHREIFPLEGEARVYERIVVDAVERWEKFVRVIAEAA